MHICETAQKCYKEAVAHGFYDNTDSLTNNVWISHRLMLIVSELSEGLEAVRDNNLACTPKSHGLGEELADACIRIFDLAYSLGLDIEEAIREKMEYNATRPYKHGRNL